MAWSRSILLILKPKRQRIFLGYPLGSDYRSARWATPLPGDSKPHARMQSQVKGDICTQLSGQGATPLPSLLWRSCTKKRISTHRSAACSVRHTTNLDAIWRVHSKQFRNGCFVAKYYNRLMHGQWLANIITIMQYKGCT
jgi:hypothetical protein